MLWTLRSVAMATGMACKNKTFSLLKTIKDWTLLFVNLPYSNREDLIGLREETFKTIFLIYRSPGLEGIKLFHAQLTVHEIYPTHKC